MKLKKYMIVFIFLAIVVSLDPSSYEKVTKVDVGSTEEVNEIDHTAIPEGDGEQEVSPNQEELIDTIIVIEEETEEFIRVKAFGAVGDGITDDTIAIQNALAQGGTIIFDEGTYIFNGKAVFTEDITLIGENATLKITDIEGDNYWYKVFDATNHNMTVDGLDFELDLADGVFPDGTTMTYRFILFTGGGANFTINNSEIFADTNQNQTNLFYFGSGTNYTITNVKATLLSTGYNGAVLWAQTSEGPISGIVDGCEFIQTSRDEIFGIWGTDDNSIVMTDTIIHRLASSVDASMFITIRANEGNAVVDAKFNDCTFINDYLSARSTISCYSLVKMDEGSVQSTFTNCNFQIAECTDAFFRGENTFHLSQFEYRSYREFIEKNLIILDNCNINLEQGILLSGNYPVNIVMNNSRLKLPEKSIVHSGDAKVAMPYTAEYSYSTFEFHPSNEEVRRLQLLNPRDGAIHKFYKCEIESLKLDHNNGIVLVDDYEVFTAFSTLVGGAYYDGCTDENQLLHPSVKFNIETSGN